MAFSVSRCEAVSNGWFTLKQGGFVTNVAPYGLSFSTITVEYLRQSDFGYLTARASSFPITSPENGAYEMSGHTSFTFPGSATNTYFSLYAPVGSFVLTSITLTGVPLEANADTTIQSLDFYTINDTHGAAVETASSYETGITRLSTFALTTERAAPESTIFLSSGDMWQGSADSNLTYGQLMVNWMNVAGFESMDIPDEGVLKDYLAQDSTFQVYVVRNPSKGKLAITKYKKISAKAGYSLLDVHLETGRKNQIRVQLGNIGHYVIGDDRYGEPSNPLKRLGLHAYELDFKNPLNNKEYKLNAPMPPEFKAMFFKSDHDKKLERRDDYGSSQRPTKAKPQKR